MPILITLNYQYRLRRELRRRTYPHERRTAKPELWNVSVDEKTNQDIETTDNER
jgi:hypothetical protein